MKFFLIYNNFFRGTSKINLEKSEKIISPNVVYCIFRVFLHICFFSCQNICTERKSENDWLVKTNSFLFGDFIFMLDTDWMAKKQLNVNSINHFYKQ